MATLELTRDTIVMFGYGVAGLLALASLIQRLARRDAAATAPAPAASPATPEIVITLDSGSPKGTPVRLSILLGQTVQAKVNGFHANGQPGAKVDPVPTWSTSDPAIVAVHQNPDGSAVLGAVGVGVATVSATSGTLSATAEIEVTPGPAASLAIEFGAPQDPGSL